MIHETDVTIYIELESKNSYRLAALYLKRIGQVSKFDQHFRQNIPLVVH